MPHTDIHRPLPVPRAPKAQTIAQAQPASGFFPRVPGPNLIGFVLLIGVVPSIFATFFIMLTTLDGGFYLGPDFLSAQRRTLAILFTIVALAAIIGMLVLRLVLKGQGGGTGMFVVLCCVLAWDAYFFLGLRQSVSAPMTQSEMSRLAAVSALPIVTFDVEGEALWATYPNRFEHNLTNLPMERLGPVICRAFGSAFRSPVYTLAIRLEADGGARDCHSEPGPVPGVVPSQPNIRQSPNANARPRGRGGVAAYKYGRPGAELTQPP